MRSLRRRILHFRRDDRWSDPDSDFDFRAWPLFPCHRGRDLDGSFSRFFRNLHIRSKLGFPLFFILFLHVFPLFS